MWSWYKEDLEDLQLTKAQFATCKKVLQTHGSGIDADWHFATPQKNGKLALTNSWHYMNDGGYYDGWIDFTVKVAPSGEIDSITLNTDSSGRYKANRIDLVNYLWDVFI